jgi:hypothetical protein
VFFTDAQNSVDKITFDRQTDNISGVVVSRRIGLSSEVYPIDPNDLVNLPGGSFSDDRKDYVVLLCGDESRGIPDSLLSDRSRIRRAIDNGDEFIPVRIAFVPRVPWWNPLPLFIRVWRNYYVSRGAGIYHTDPFVLRDLGIERGRYALENAYSFASNSTRDIREARYNTVASSILKDGWKDAQPLEIMVLRQMGAQDNLNDGHHRMGICMTYGIRRASVRFAFAGKSSDWLLPLLRSLARLILRAKLYLPRLFLL